MSFLSLRKIRRRLELKELDRCFRSVPSSSVPTEDPRSEGKSKAQQNTINGRSRNNDIVRAAYGKPRIGKTIKAWENLGKVRQGREGMERYE